MRAPAVGVAGCCRRVASFDEMLQARELGTSIARVHAMPMTSQPLLVPVVEAELSRVTGGGIPPLWSLIPIAIGYALSPKRSGRPRK